MSQIMQVARWRLPWLLTITDVKSNYRESRLGLLWFPLSALLSTFALLGALTFVRGIPPTGDTFIQLLIGLSALSLCTEVITSSARGLEKNRIFLFVPDQSISPIPSSIFLTALIRTGPLLLVATVLTALNHHTGMMIGCLLVGITTLIAVAAGLANVMVTLGALLSDIRHIAPFVARLLLFASPILYLPGETGAYETLLASTVPTFAPIGLLTSTAQGEPSLELVPFALLWSAFLVLLGNWLLKHFNTSHLLARVG